MRNLGHRQVVGDVGRRAFAAVLTQGPLSRSAIADRVGVSPATVTKAARPLVEAGYLVEEADTGRSATRIGRPPTPLRLCAQRCFFVGVKVTADELIGVVVDLQATVRDTARTTIRSTAVADVVASLADLVEELLAGQAEHRDRAVMLGVSLAGDLDSTSGIVRYSPFLGWRDVPLGTMISDATGMTTLLENDVTALTVAEQWFGAGVDTSSFAVVTVGVGIGCGLVVNGSVVSGATGVAGEIGHVPVGGAHPSCVCGGTGCVEAIASSVAIAERVGVAVGDSAMTFERAMALAEDGEVSARTVFSEAGHAVGRALATVANLVGPELIVISGEGVPAYCFFEQQVRASFSAQSFGSAGECALLVRPLSDEEWARGSAAVAVRRFVTSVGS